MTLLRAADLKRDGKDFWVAQDRNPVERRSSERSFWFETPFEEPVDNSLHRSDHR